MNKATENLEILAVEFASLLRNKGPVLITTHAAPDGDAIASLLSAAEMLMTLGNDPTCALEGGVPPRFDFLPGAEIVLDTGNSDIPKCDCVMVVDSANIERIGTAAKIISSDATVVNIDHHEDNDRFGNLIIVQPGATSTTEILFDISKILGIPITEKLATQLYTGLMTDSGGFRFSNTSDRSFTIAAELVKHGVKPDEIYRQIFSNNSIETMKQLGEALASLELYADGSVAIMTVQVEDKIDELEELAEYALHVKDVHASALFRLKQGMTRVSLRGKEPLNIATVARKFGGGGHPQAAGFTSLENPEKLSKQVILALTEEIEKYTSSNP